MRGYLRCRLDHLAGDCDGGATQYISFTFVVTHTGACSQRVTSVVSYTYAGGSGSAQAPLVVEPYRVFLPIVLEDPSRQ